jgi:hypothetical protein
METRLEPGFNALHEGLSSKLPSCWHIRRFRNEFCVIISENSEIIRINPDVRLNFADKNYERLYNFYVDKWLEGSASANHNFRDRALRVGIGHW